jgi:hypothetical protein
MVAPIPVKPPGGTATIDKMNRFPDNGSSLHLGVQMMGKSTVVQVLYLPENAKDVVMFWGGEVSCFVSPVPHSFQNLLTASSSDLFTPRLLPSGHFKCHSTLHTTMVSPEGLNLTAEYGEGV